jgi:tetratricopeptide (TPR) repeat protein
MTNKKRRTRAGRTSSSRPGTIQVVTYEITDEPILDREYKRLPQDVKEAINRLHDLSQQRPREAIPELLEWIEQYPSVPLFYNYLTAAYSLSGRREKAEATIEENYRRNPNYLFARVHYGELCLTRHQYDRVAEIFDHKFDLKLLYPNRNRFHVSEVLGFMGLFGVYFYEIGQRETAEKYYTVLHQIDPSHVQTRRLRRMLSGGLWGGLFRLARKPRAPHQ